MSFRSASAAVRLFAALAAGMAACICPGAAAAEPGGLHAGAAAVEITPPLGVKIVGNWNSPVAQRVHDPLHARALVLTNGDDRLAIVLCDNLGAPREVFDAAKALIAAETNLAPAQVLTASTHTHTGPSARGETNKVSVAANLDDYQRQLARGVADAVRQAVDQLEPAELAWGSVDAPAHVFNRRWFVSDPKLARNPFGGVDKVRMNPPRRSGALVKPAGPVDPEAAFLFVRSRVSQADGSPSRRPIALLANYSLHYVGGVVGGELSADYFGAFARRIAARLDAERLTPRFVGILSNGTSGDVNNMDFTAVSPRRPPYSQMETVADDLAAKIAAAQADLVFQEDVPLASAQRELVLSVRKPTPEQLAFYKQAEARAAAGEEPYQRHEAAYARRGRDLTRQPDAVAILVQAHRVGPVGIAAIPFETFTETGLELKRAIPALPGFDRAFTIELANGSYGYLPTPKQHALGGYETWLGTNVVQQDATVVIVQALQELFADLSDANRPPDAEPAPAEPVAGPQ